MKLYEIDQAILDCIDPESGEIIDIERLEALEMEREQKIENVILWRKSLKAEGNAIKDEVKILNRRAEIDFNKADSLDGWIAKALNGEKFKTPRCSVSYRRTSSVKIDDLAKIAKKFLKNISEDWVSKTAIKDAIEKGETVDGAHIEEKQSMIVK